MESLKNKTIAIIGVGRIGGTIASGLIHNHVIAPDKIMGSTRHEEQEAEVGKRHGIKMVHDNNTLVKNADIILLAVKPQNVKTVLNEIASNVKPEQIVIALTAATTTHFIEENLKGSIPVIRAMPNTACLVNEGMTVLCPGKHAGKEHLETAKAIFKSIGRVEVIYQEEMMDAVTALSGSGPAYAYIIIESLAEGGVKTGLPRELATTLAAQSMLGGAKMVLETGEHPAKLKDSVTTPAGVTMDAIMELEDGGLRVALIKAIAKATEKSKDITH